MNRRMCIPYLKPDPLKSDVTGKSCIGGGYQRTKIIRNQFNYVGQKQTVDLPLRTNANFAYERFSPCSVMAKVVHFNCKNSTKEAVFDDIINYFANCCVVGVDFNNLDNLTTI